MIAPGFTIIGLLAAMAFRSLAMSNLSAHGTRNRLFVAAMILAPMPKRLRPCFTARGWRFRQYAIYSTLAAFAAIAAIGLTSLFRALPF